MKPGQYITVIIDNPALTMLVLVGMYFLAYTSLRIMFPRKKGSVPKMDNPPSAPTKVTDQRKILIWYREDGYVKNKVIKAQELKNEKLFRKILKYEYA